jgi:hypothetical protein
VTRMEEISARDAQWVDALQDYNFPPTLGHAIRDVRYLLGRVAQLEAALASKQCGPCAVPPLPDCQWRATAETPDKPFISEEALRLQYGVTPMNRGVDAK